MPQFDEFIRGYLATLVGIHVGGLKSEMMDGTFKRGVRILQADEDIIKLMASIHEFYTGEKPVLPAETLGEARKQAARGMVNISGPNSKGVTDGSANDGTGPVDRSAGAGASPRPGQGAGASGKQPTQNNPAAARADLRPGANPGKGSQRDQAGR